jgi:hypothetical protein
VIFANPCGIGMVLPTDMEKKPAQKSTTRRPNQLTASSVFSSRSWHSVDAGSATNKNGE